MDGAAGFRPHSFYSYPRKGEESYIRLSKLTARCRFRLFRLFHRYILTRTWRNGSYALLLFGDVTYIGRLGYITELHRRTASLYRLVSHTDGSLHLHRDYHNCYACHLSSNRDCY